MSTSEPVATSDVIVLPIPASLAAEFVLDESDTVTRLRDISLLRLGTTDLGFWRMEGITSQIDDIGTPRMVATLRRVLP